MNPSPRRLVRRLAPPLITLLFVASSPAAHADEARFGDSTWVAPYPIATDPGDPTADGPRVALEDHEPVGESILRTPFRVAFWPLRLLARGIEIGAGIALPELQKPPIRIGFYTEVAKITPTITYSSDTGIEPGFEIRRRSNRVDVPNIHIAGGWSTRGQRDAMARVVAGLDTSLWGAGVEGRYKLVPNYRFYGLGNSATDAGRSIYKDERGDFSTWLRVGENPLREARLMAGYSSISSSGGSHGSPALQDAFDPATVPFFGQDSHVFWLGAGGDWSFLNSWRDPMYGFHARGEIRHYHSTDGTGVKYVEIQGEARGYIPVLATRRTLAIRLAYDGANPDRGSAAIPFYRLPTSFGRYRFDGYHSNEFRDQVLAIAQVEYRWLILRGLQALAVAQLGEVAPRAKSLRIADVHESYGGGLRYPLSKGASVRVLASKGSEGLVFLLVGGSDF